MVCISISSCSLDSLGALGNSWDQAQKQKEVPKRPAKTCLWIYGCRELRIYGSTFWASSRLMAKNLFMALNFKTRPGFLSFKRWMPRPGRDNIVFGLSLVQVWQEKYKRDQHSHACEDMWSRDCWFVFLSLGSPTQRFCLALCPLVPVILCCFDRIDSKYIPDVRLFSADPADHCTIPNVKRQAESFNIWSFVVVSTRFTEKQCSQACHCSPWMVRLYATTLIEELMVRSMIFRRKSFRGFVETLPDLLKMPRKNEHSFDS